MDINLDKSLESFRNEVSAFLDSAATESILEAGRKTTSVFAPFEQIMQWHNILYKKGWVASGWPTEYGGTGWSVEQRYIFSEECWRRDLPPLLPHGLNMVGPLLIDLGTEEQKRKYLPGILSGEDFWTQGYSEPNSGSDLASLSCSAVADGDDYVINGSKIWTTYAHHANRMFMLVRTNKGGKKQEGITFLLLDSIDLPGLTIREIVGLDGVPEQCEVFFDNVRVPQSGRVGEENAGWAVAKHLLKHERGGAAAGPMLLNAIRKIRRAAAETPSAFGDMLSEDPAFQSQLGEVEADVRSFDHYEKLALSGGEPSHDPAFPSLKKTMSSELTQKISTLMMEISGLEALPRQLDAIRVGANVEPLGTDFELLAMPYYLNSRAASIYAGSNEIQRDLIARSLPSG